MSIGSGDRGRSAPEAGRYVLTDLISSHEPSEHYESFEQYPTELWRGQDLALERPISVRLIRNDDARFSAVLQAARSAAVVDDRRLLRVLDILEIPGTAENPTRTAIVSEWSSGQNLAERLQDDEFFDFSEAVAEIADLARVLNLCHQAGVMHGRLRPTAVIWSDGGEARLRGLAIDHVLFGPIDPATSNPDIDGLGCLLYAMVTGRWPALQIDANSVHIPLAPATGKSVPLPSRVRAGVPGEIDDLVSRAVRQVARARGTMPLTTIESFASTAGLASDRLSPVATHRIPSVAERLISAAAAGVAAASRGDGEVEESDGEDEVLRDPLTPYRIAWRAAGVAVGVAIAWVFAWVGWQQLTATAEVEVSAPTSKVLETDAIPFEEDYDANLSSTLVIVGARSYDPLDDQNGDGRPDGAPGKERNGKAKLAIDADGSTAWLTRKYDTPNMDGKGGVGLIVDLGSPMQISSVDVGLEGFGSDLSVRVADQILDDPELWTEFASVNDAGPEITLRSPRPVTGQYVLVWFSGLPALPATSAGADARYQGGIRQISIAGIDPADADSSP